MRKRAQIAPAEVEKAALEEKRRAVVSRAVEAAEEVVELLLEEARGGNVQACKLLLQVAGLLQTGGSVVATQVNVPQIVITPEELEELERNLKCAEASCAG